MTLLTKHRLFCDKFFKTGNAAASYQDVYKCKPTGARQSAHKLLQRADIQDYLANLEAKSQDIAAIESVIDQAEAMSAETKIVRHTVKDLLDENGDIKDLKDWPDDLAYVVKDIEYAHMPVGSDAHGNPVTVKYIRKIHFYDKGQALGRVERVLGMNEPDVHVHHHHVMAEIKAMMLRLDGRDRGKLPAEND